MLAGTVPTAILAEYRSTADYRQQQPRRVMARVVYAIYSGANVLFSVLSNDASGVGVAVEAREVATRHFNTDSVIGAEHVCSRAKVDGEFVDSPSLEQRGFRKRMTVASSKDAVGQILGPS